MKGDLDEDCIQTFEQVKEDLEQVEDQLARQLNLRSRQIRRELCALAQQEKLVEDELAERWLELYTIYVDWLKREARKEQDEHPPPLACEEREQGAASAALSFFVVACSCVGRCLCCRCRSATSSAAFRA